MEETILTWNVPNFITVIVMVILGFAILGMVAKFLSKMKGSADA